METAGRQNSGRIKRFDSMNYVTACAVLFILQKRQKNIRNCPKSQRDDIKDKGGFVAGHLRDNRRQANKVVCRSMLVYDLDNIETEFLQNIGSKISNKGCYYTTHSHPRSIRGRE